MLRNRIQRLACAANTLAYVLVFAVVIIHVLHRRTAANVGPGEHNVVFWFEAGDDGDDQRPFHRPFSVDPRVLLGALGTFAIAALCDAGGTTGAASIMGLFVPLYCLVVGFGLKESTGLAQAAIAGASLASVAFNLFRSHPWDPSKPLLDLDLALILAPTSLLGVSVGVLLNDLLPNWLIMAVLVGLLVYVCRRKAIAGLTAIHEEAQHEAAQAAAAAISSGPVPQLRPICTASSSIGSTPREAVQQAVHRAVHGAIQQAVQSDVCGDSSSTSGGSPRGAVQHVIDEAVQQAVQQQWDGPQLPAAAAAATAGNMCDHLLSSSGNSGGSLAAAAVSVAAAATAADSDASIVPQQQEQAYIQPSLLKQQQQQQQHIGKRDDRFAYAVSSSSSSDDLRTPLLDCSEQSPAAATATDAGSSSSSRSTPPTRTRGYIPIVPFMSSVALPLPPVSPLKQSHNLLQPPAAAAAAVGARSSAVFAGHVISFSAFPWIKFVSMLLLCFGFFGLAMLGGLIPLCSWYFVTYMMSFLSVTVFVTFVFVKVILIDPLATAAAFSKLYSTMEQGSTTAGAAAAAGRGSTSSSCDRRLIERFVTWLNVIFGTEVAVKRQQAAAAGSDSELTGEQQQQQGDGEQRSLHKTMSMFRRQQLKQQLQLQQPFLHQQHSFTNIKSAAAAAAVAAAAAAEAHDVLRADGPDFLDPVDSSSFVPQPSSLVHVAAAGAAVAGAAGVVTGVCGLAGAALLVPILLDFRVHPQVATATSVLLVCMSSATGVLSFLMQGRLVVSYALLFSAVAAAGVCAGVWIIGGLVRRVCKPSTVTLVLALLTGLAALVTLLFGAEEFAVNFAAGEGLGFRALCSYR